MVAGVFTGGHLGSVFPALVLGGGRWNHDAVAGRNPVAHSGSIHPTTGRPGSGSGALTGQLASDMSEAAPNSLSAALMDSWLALIASHASLASRVASIATSAGWSTTRSLLAVIISFFELHNCLPNPRRTVSLGSVNSLVTACMV